jgi:hypothetical protein
VGHHRRVHILAYQINWGSVPDWIAAIGSVLAFTGFAIAFIWEVRKRRLDDEQDRIPRRHRGPGRGHPTGNTQTDYAHQLSTSSQADLVRDAYRLAGLDLHADLERLAKAPRVEPDPDAQRWLHRLTPSGDLRVSVLALHSTGDGLAVPEHESAYTQGLSGLSTPAAAGMSASPRPS